MQQSILIQAPIGLTVVLESLYRLCLYCRFAFAMYDIMNFVFESRMSVVSSAIVVKQAMTLHGFPNIIWFGPPSQ